MNNSKNSFFKYTISSYYFLERARKQLELFDKGTTESLFYAALELRMGIEARLYDYIKASLHGNKKPPEKIKDYSATILLKKLSEIDHNADESVTMSISREGSGEGFSLQYIPITKELASYHGRLGGMLHFIFFENNPNWFIKKSLHKDKKETLLDYRNFLEKIAEELDKVNRGALLAHPKFIEFIDKLSKEE